MPDQNARPVLTPISKSISRLSADCVINFINFSFLGGCWGCFNPTPMPGSKEATAIAQSGKYVPLRPFSSLSSVGYYGATMGSIAFVSTLASGGVAMARNQDDALNLIFGTGAAYAYWMKVLSHNERALWNNRIVGGAIVGSFLYANTAP